MNYPGQPGGYPNQPGGYPNQPGGYSNQPSGYPAQQSGYPSGGATYPNQPPYPHQPSGYPGQPPYLNEPSTYPDSPVRYGLQPNQPYSSQSNYPNPMTGYQSYSGGHNHSGGYPSQHSDQFGGHQFGYNPNFTNGPRGYENNDGYSSGMLGAPTIRPYAGFNPNADSETLRKAMKGIGCDKSKVIAVLCARSNSQRQEIATTFKTMYGKDLRKELEKELSGDFEDFILGLMDPPAVYDAYHLRKAMAGLGTKESVLIEIMCSRTNGEIAEIKRVYRQLYKQELEHDIIGDTSGHFQRLLVSLSAAGRDESTRTDPLKANQDAHALHRAGEQRLGTDEACFNAILASQNYSQLRLVFQEYQKITGHSIEKAIEAEFSGDIKSGLLAVVSCVQNRAAYFAKLLYDSMAGLGTRDTDLIRIIVSRSEVDLADIRQEFQRLYKKSLIDMIKGDCSGAYKDGLIAVVNGN